MAFFPNDIMHTLSTLVNNLNSNINIFRRMNRTISHTQLSEVRECLDDIFKEVESRDQIELVNTNLSPDSVINNGEDRDNDNDWSTIASEENEELHADEETNTSEHCNCHETTAQPIFALPEGIILGECPVCYDEIKMINMAVTRCGHVFHASCVFESLEHRIDCPLCRTQLVNEIFEVDDDN
jgi:Zinc finger, C3HC4 type (RING finger)